MYRWVDHTAELELEISARDPRAVLEDAMSALAELHLGHAAGLPPVDARTSTSLEPDVRLRRRIVLEAGDLPALLAAWLEELVYLAESEGFIALTLVSAELQAPARLAAEVLGELGEPPPLVKAVTYHRLVFESRGDGYVAGVVLDV